MENAITVSSSGTWGQRPLGLWDQTKKPVLLAAVALAVGVMASRRRGQRGLFGTVVKGALYGAFSAIPEIVLRRLSKRFLSHRPANQSANGHAAAVATSR